jgi:hypothetical protein
MTTKHEHPEVKAIASRYERAKSRYEELRDELKAAIVKELRAGARPADLSRASGWDREYLRRIKATADKDDAERAVAEAAEKHDAPDA